MGDNAEVSEDRRHVSYPNGSSYTYSDEAEGYIADEKPKEGSTNVSKYRSLDPRMYDWLRQQYDLRHPTSTVVIKFPEYKKGLFYKLVGELASGRYLSEKENRYIWTVEENERYVGLILEVAIGEVAVPFAVFVWASRGGRLLRFFKYVKIFNKADDAAKGGTSFFQGTKYTNKVLGQMKTEPFHAFPESVKAFESSGVISTIKGGDGITRQMLKIPGEYGGKKGFFEFIKEADGSINHRFFRPNP